MSGTGSISDDVNGLIGTIETDLSNAGDWLEQEALAGGEALWGVLKIAFELITSAQARVLIDVFSRIESDNLAGKSLEQIETDVLQTASADELAILQQAGSEIIQGILAFLQANQVAAKMQAKLAAKGS